MLAAAIFSLIIPGLDIASATFGGKTAAAPVIGLGILLGAGAICLINRYVPHEHFIFGREGPITPSLRRMSPRSRSPSSCCPGAWASPPAP